MQQIRYGNFASCFTQWIHKSFFEQGRSLAEKTAKAGAAVFMLRMRRRQNHETRAKQKKQKRQLRMWSNSDSRWSEVRCKKEKFLGGSTSVLSFIPQPLNTLLLSNASMSISQLLIAQTVCQYLNGYLDTFQCRKYTNCVCVPLFSTT